MMKTISSVIESEIRARIGFNETCQQIVEKGTTNNDYYDKVIEESSILAERLIKNNFELIIELAKNPPEHKEETIKKKKIKPVTSISDEDEEMLRFIQG